MDIPCGGYVLLREERPILEKSTQVMKIAVARNKGKIKSIECSSGWALVGVALLMECPGKSL